MLCIKTVKGGLMLAGFTGGASVKNLPAHAGDAVDGFDPWVGEIPWSNLAWKILWAEELDGLQFVGLPRVKT